MHRSIARFILLVLSTTTVSTYAQQGADELEDVFGGPETISIATGREQVIHAAPAVASVITAEQIRDSGARDFVDVLNMVPGFHVGVSFIYEPIFAVRGFTSGLNQNVLIMLDGVPQTELFFGERRISLGKIALDIIERIEVIRGPGSALYGADAFSAVVNIITRRAAPQDAQVTLSRGSDDTSDVRAIGGARIAGANVVAALEYYRTDGHEPLIEQDQQTLLDAAFGTNASLAPGEANTHREELGAQVNITGENNSLSLRLSSWRDRGLGIGIGSALDPFGTIDSDVAEATYKHTRDLTRHVNVSATANYMFTQFEFNDVHFFPPGAFFVFPEGVILNEEHEQEFFRLRGDIGYSGFSGHYLSFGVGGEWGDFEQDSESRNYTTVDGVIVPIGPVQDTLDTDPIIPPDGEESRNLGYVYIQDEWTFHPAWTLTWGVRYDDYSDFGDTINPRAVLVWNTRPDLTLKLLYGRGFRSPSFVETQSQHLPAIQSNSNLDPEKLNTVEFAVDYRPRRNITTRVNIFYHNTEDQIRQQNTGGPEFRPENVGDQEGHGLELELWWEILRNMEFYGYYAYQQNDDETTNEDAGYSPHHRLFGMLKTDYRDWFFNLRATYVGERDRVAEDPRSDPETYTLWDGLVRYDLAKNLAFSADVRNIFDEDVEEASFGTSVPVDMPLADRTYYFSLIGKF